MPRLVELVFAPIVLPLRLLDDIHRIADAAESISGRLRPVEHDIDGLREAFEGSNRQIAKLRRKLTPQLAALHAELTSLRAQIGGDLAEMEDSLAEVRETVEPLQGAAKRVGRAVERLPGPGRGAG